jgi:hypothetical protein
MKAVDDVLDNTGGYVIDSSVTTGNTTSPKPPKNDNTWKAIFVAIGIALVIIAIAQFK